MDIELKNVENVAGGAGLFTGQYVHTLDPKKRISVPAEWRKVLKSQALCLLANPAAKELIVFTQEDVMKRVEELRGKSLMGDAKSRTLLDVIGQAMQQVTIDPQGRIRINDILMEYAGISNAVEFVGGMNTATLRAAVKGEKKQFIDTAALANAMQELQF